MFVKCTAIVYLLFMNQISTPREIKIPGAYKLINNLHAGPELNYNKVENYCSIKQLYTHICRSVNSRNITELVINLDPKIFTLK